MGPSVTTDTQTSARNQRGAHWGANAETGTGEGLPLHARKAQTHWDLASPWGALGGSQGGRIGTQTAWQRSLAFTPPCTVRKKVSWLELQEKTQKLVGSGYLQTSTSMGFHPRGRPGGRRSSCCDQSMERAKSQWAQGRAWSQGCPGNPGQQPHQQDGPRRRQAGRAPASQRMGGCLTDPLQV